MHERAAQAIERLFAERLPEHYNALAHHYSRSGNTAKAIDYLHRAGQQAVERSAYAEAVSHLTSAFDLLTTLPETPRAQPAGVGRADDSRHGVGGDQGPGGPGSGTAYTRARALCEQVGEPPQLFRVLWGLWGFITRRGEYQTMRALGEQLLSLAQRLQDPDLLLEAHQALWTSLVLWRRAGRRPARTRNRGYGSMTRSGTAPMPRSTAGTTLGCVAASLAAPTLWLLGLPRPGGGQQPGGAGPGPAARPPLESGHRPVLGCLAASPAPGGAPDPGTRRGRHDHRDRAGVSATSWRRQCPCGAGRWPRVGTGRRA